MHAAITKTWIARALKPPMEIRAFSVILGLLPNTLGLGKEMISVYVAGFLTLPMDVLPKVIQFQ